MKGCVLARHQTDFEAADETYFDMAELIRSLAGGTKIPLEGSRSAALARFLSGEDHGESLGGAFASAALTEGKEI